MLYIHWTQFTSYQQFVIAVYILDLDQYISGEVSKPEGDEAKATHKKKLVKSKIIIAKSIKDYLIPHVSSIKTPKEVYDALTKMFEGKKSTRRLH